MGEDNETEKFSIRWWMEKIAPSVATAVILAGLGTSATVVLSYSDFKRRLELIEGWQNEGGRFTAESGAEHRAMITENRNDIDRLKIESAVRMSDVKANRRDIELLRRGYNGGR